MVYSSKRLEMYFQFCYMVFNIFQQSRKMFLHSVSLSVRPFAHALTVANTIQMSLNLYMLFIPDIKLTVLKMIRMGLIVRLQRHMKVFRCITACRGGNVFKVYYNLFVLH